MDVITKAFNAAGGPTRLAERLSLRPNVVTNWRLRQRIPEEHCPGVEIVTGVRCEQLRPDVVWTRDITGQVTGYHVPLKSAAA